ncbi:MAG: transcription elongation factor GreB [Lysobacterales bacterium]
MSSPSATKSRYITLAGHKTLKAEFERLWRRERPLVVKALGEAAAEGDRSENAEYIYRKKQLREMDRRIRYLAKRLDVVCVVEQLPADRGRVFFGAWVVLHDSAGKRQRYRLVGADEIGAAKGHISIDSPMAKALLGHRVGDEFSVTTPAGEADYEILGISYESLK